MQLNSTEISELIKQRIAQFNVVSEAHNEGTIVSVSDGSSAYTAGRSYAGRNDRAAATVTQSH